MPSTRLFSFRLVFDRSSLMAGLLLVSAWGIPTALQAQTPAIGEWRPHLPLSNAIGVAESKGEVLCATTLAAFRYRTEDGNIERLSTVDALGDIGVSGLYPVPDGEGQHGGASLLVYANSNVDVLYPDGSIFNFPAIRNANIVGDKRILDVGFRGDSAYLACGFGVVVLDLERRLSPATYFFSNADGTPIRVNAVRAFGDSLYAATELGLYRAWGQDPLLEEFARWALATDAGLPAGEADALVVWNDQLHVQYGALLYARDAGEWMPWYNADPAELVFRNGQGDGLLLIEHFIEDETVDSARTVQVFPDGSIMVLEDPVLPVPMAVVPASGGGFWFADLFRGLALYRDGGVQQSIVPNGPGSAKAFNMAVLGDRIWVAPGDVNGSWNRLNNQDGFFRHDAFGWANFNDFNFSPLDSINDVLAVTLDPFTKDAWLGSFGDGLIRLPADGDPEVFKQAALDNAVGDPLNYRVAGLHYDPITGHVWIANNGAAQPIVVREYQTGTFYRFPSGLPASAGEAIAQVLTDDFGQVWYQVARGGGILVYDPGENLASTGDDRRKVLRQGAGNGNLPSTEVNALVKDLDGEIWIGTNTGIAVFYNPSAVLDPGTLGDASQIIVELDGFPAILFEDETVNTLAVDGANRKWLGTENGAFLISEDGTQQLLHFTEDNSPLLSNSVRSIAVNAETGEVFFGTSEGIVSYRGDATVGGETHSAVYVFPNPVREDYQGPIAIRGLVQDADVKITDTRGRLVYETTALGGQAVWDGRLVGSGKRAATGVYFVYSTDFDGQEKFATKFLMIGGE
jgi:hypothetical protein